jgi:hypothetical protein
MEGRENILVRVVSKSLRRKKEFRIFGRYVHFLSVGVPETVAVYSGLTTRNWKIATTKTAGFAALLVPLALAYRFLWSVMERIGSSNVVAARSCFMSARCMAEMRP